MRDEISFLYISSYIRSFKCKKCLSFGAYFMSLAVYYVFTCVSKHSLFLYLSLTNTARRSKMPLFISNQKITHHHLTFVLFCGIFGLKFFEEMFFVKFLNELVKSGNTLKIMILSHYHF